MTTFNWSIERLDRELIDGYVYQVHYTVQAVDADKTVSVRSSVWLQRPVGELVPYTALTPKLTVDWVRQHVDAPAIEAALQAHIDEQRQPSRGSGIPWQA